jgi:hypothetical protein
MFGELHYPGDQISESFKNGRQSYVSELKEDSHESQPVGDRTFAVARCRAARVGLLFDFQERTGAIHS